MQIHIVMLFLACASVLLLIVQAFKEDSARGFARIAGRPLAFTFIFSGLWLITSVIHEARPEKRDFEGKWLADNHSRVVVIHKNGTLESFPDGMSGTWSRNHRDSFVVKSFGDYAGGKYDSETDVMSLSRTGTGSRGPWVHHHVFERVTEANEAIAAQVMAGTAANDAP